MLTVTIFHYGDRITIKLTGQLVGKWTEELASVACPVAALEVDLSDVTFVDADGEEGLRRLRRAGATFRGKGSLARAMSSRLHIPLSV